jgi:hypothetical protein
MMTPEEIAKIQAFVSSLPHGGIVIAVDGRSPVHDDDLGFKNGVLEMAPVRVLWDHLAGGDSVSCVLTLLSAIRDESSTPGIFRHAYKTAIDAISGAVSEALGADTVVITDKD